jgi:hypothetical protein
LQLFDVVILPLLDFLRLAQSLLFELGAHCSNALLVFGPSGFDLSLELVAEFCEESVLLHSVVRHQGLVLELQIIRV